MKKSKRIKVAFDPRILYAFILLSFVVSIVFVSIKLALSPVTADKIGERTRADYILMLLQCAFGVVAILCPSFINKKIKLIIPSHMMIAYAVFLYCAIYLGEVRAFYYNVPHWDSYLHTFSAMMLGTLGYSFISLLNNSDKIPINLSPAFVFLFTFCFAVTIGAIWEIYEFLGDLIFNTNMQKYMLSDGTNLIGKAALTDTMKDIILDALGSLVIAIIGYISQKKKKNYLEKFELKAEI